MAFPRWLPVSLLLMLSAPFMFATVEGGNEDCPNAVISSEELEILIYLPDEEKGHYRGTRFDWSGLIQHVKCDGHTFFGDWKPTHEPENPEDANAIATEFGMGEFGLPAPLNFDEAKAGETFVKIGVGLLKKPDQNPYRFMNRYEIVNAFDWDIQQGKNWIEFRQESSPCNGYAYRYTKRIEIDPAHPAFTVRHTLENAGSKEFSQAVYCHNFYRVDDHAIDESYSLEFPFMVQGSRNWRGAASTAERALRISRLVNRPLFNELEGFEAVPEHNQVSISHKETNTALRIAGSHPPVKFNFYATSLTICPEPFIAIHLKPGEAMSWENRYEFSTPGISGQ